VEGFRVKEGRRGAPLMGGVAPAGYVVASAGSASEGAPLVMSTSGMVAYGSVGGMKGGTDVVVLSWVVTGVPGATVDEAVT